MIAFSDKTALHQGLMDRARCLPAAGVLKVRPDGYSYLSVDERYFSELFPMVHDRKRRQPNYFNRPDACGAHVSLCYPDEAAALAQAENGACYSFQIAGFYQTTFAHKSYYILSLVAPELEAFRLSCGLSPLPRYKGFEVPFHITIAVR